MKEMLSGHIDLNKRWGSVLQYAWWRGLEVREVVSRSDNRLLHYHMKTLAVKHAAYDDAYGEKEVARALEEYKSALCEAEVALDPVMRKGEPEVEVDDTTV